MLQRYFLPFCLLSMVVAGCSNDSTPKDVIVSDSVTTIKNVDSTLVHPKYDMVISDIPFPFEILDNLHTSNIAFDVKVMNPVGNTNKYNQYNSEALSLGVYGADLAYAVTYEQFQQIGPYVKSAKKIAEDLNIPFAFNQDMMDKYNKYKENKDSLTRIVYDSYNQVDKTLKGDERVGIAALVVTGSWLEGLYISTKTFVNADKNDSNTGLYKTIGNQKQSLKIVIKLLSEYKKDAYIAGLINDLNDITSAYDKVTTDNLMNERQLIAINTKVEKLRARIIEGI